MDRPENSDAPTDARNSFFRGIALPASVIVGLYICYELALPFVPAIIWALTIAVLAAPMHRIVKNTLRNGNLSAAVSVTLLAIAIVAIALLPGQQIIAILNAGIREIQNLAASGELQQRFHSSPPLSWISGTVDDDQLKTILGNFGTWLTSMTGSFLQASVSSAITLILAFYFLFYFLRDHRDILSQIKLLSPLQESETNYLFVRVYDTIHGVVFGTLVTAMVQGTLGGLIFWFLAIPNPVFWALVMALLAIIPIFGAFVVWIPAAAYLLVTGSWADALLLTAYGVIVIGGIDNILYPVLAGGRLRMHTLPAFVSIVGGLILFGASGIILGPLVVTLTVALVDVWRARTNGSTG